MAGLRGNNAWFMLQKQTERGKVAAVNTTSGTASIKNPYASGNIGPTREIGTLAETDANRDQGVSYVKTTGVKGNPECYVRDASVGALLFGVLGTDVVEEVDTTFTATAASGATEMTAVSSVAGLAVGQIISGASIPVGTTITEVGTATLKISEKTTGIITAASIKSANFTHTFNPGNVLPYFTAWSMLSETLYEQHQDCILSDLEIKATAGSPLTATSTILGTKTTRLLADPSSGVALQKGLAYNFNFGKVELAGGVTALISSMTLNITNSAVAQQTDEVTPLDIAVGKRTVSCSFDMLFENLEEYNKFYYGGVSGTAIANKLYETSIKYTYTPEGSTTNSIVLSVPAFAYEEFPIAPEVQGAPLVVSVKGVAQRSSSPVVTATVKNQQRSY